MVLDTWELAGTACKMFVLLGTAGVLGGAFSLALTQWLNFSRQAEMTGYLPASAVLGLLATGLFFLVQVGAINESGVAGMLDIDMGMVLAQSSVGHVTGLRVLGFACVILAWLCLRHHQELVKTTPPVAKSSNKAALMLLSLALVLIAVSFALSGHVSTLPALARVAIVLHVVAACWWVGSLYPLLRLSRTPDQRAVHELMRCFGRSALFIVAVLVVSGIFLLTLLLQSLDELWTTAYGRTLLLKLATVSVLLILAATNKLLLVPRLLTRGSIKALQTSIRLELVTAAFILGVTAWLTTVVGPAHT
jgi:copper resistance protein D